MEKIPMKNSAIKIIANKRVAQEKGIKSVKKIPVSKVMEISDNLLSNSVLKAREAKGDLIKENNNPSMKTINKFNSAYKDKANADRYRKLAESATSKLIKK